MTNKLSSLLTALVFLSLCILSPKGLTRVYELTLQTNSNWTRIEIRDDAQWVNAPNDHSIEISSRKGIKSFTISRKTMFLRTTSRGEVDMKLFVDSDKQVLGLNICKGSASSYTWIQSEQSKQKNDVKEKDHCEKAALVLQLY